MDEEQRLPDRLLLKGRGQTFDHTVMSGRMSIRLVDFAAFSFAFDRVVAFRSRCFWCETGAVES
jgi:hypothetical protein